MAVIILTISVAACGPRNHPTETPDKVDADAGNADGDATSPSTLSKLVERLNAAIAEGNETEAEAIIENDTAGMLVEAMGLVPENQPAGEEFALVDFLDWEKAQGVVFVLENEKVDKGTGMLIGQVNGLDEFEGEVCVKMDGDEAKLEFYDLAGQIRDEILSKGLAREKFIEIVDNVNKAIKEENSNLLQNSLTLDTLNAEIKLLSYMTQKKSNWSLKGVVKRMKSKGFEYSVKGLDVDKGSATLIVTDGDGSEVIKGDVIFTTEVGMMRLDYKDLLQTLIDAEQAKIDKKKGK